MNLGQSKIVLNDEIQKNGDLRPAKGRYMHWNVGEEYICLDGDFTLEELEAINIYINSFQQPPTDNVKG